MKKNTVSTKAPPAGGQGHSVGHAQAARIRKVAARPSPSDWLMLPTRARCAIALALSIGEPGVAVQFLRDDPVRIALKICQNPAKGA